ncbi:MAG: peptidylprolyl isomerase [Bacteroidales bacterium]|jgi:FKBP-type peptidyl-prolyl cis-trans isomerase|nr:peptidylprolyl isomerase [Bacteroidales bacterium]
MIIDINISRVLIIVLLLGLSSCSSSQSRKEQRAKSSSISLDRYIELNKQMVDDEQKVIGRYVEEHKLDMNRTQTGLWYAISEPGSGDKIVSGKVVTLNYEIRLLDGTLCYSSQRDGQKVFLVGQGGVEAGLEEGILMLKPGGKATFLMPPHLAHGLVGDDDQIPSRAILRYEVEVSNVENKN